MEPHPLWEYPSYPLSDVYELFALDFRKTTISGCEERTLGIEIKHEGLLNGAAIWYELEFDDEDKNDAKKSAKVVNTGLVEEPVRGKHLKWSRDFKQAVCILENKIQVKEPSKMKLKCILKFKPSQGEFKVDFKTD